MLMSALLQTKLMLFKPWSHQVPLFFILYSGSCRDLCWVNTNLPQGTWELHTPGMQQMKI